MKVKEIAEEAGNIENRTYAEVTCAGRNPTRILSKTNNADKNQKQNIHEKLPSVSRRNRFRRQGDNLSKKPSSLNITKKHKQQLKINELQEEINWQKHQQIANEQPAKTETAHQTANLSQAIAKNVNMGSVTNRGQQENID